LRRRGVNPWLDREQIRPGQPFADAIQQAIATVRTAAIFIGPHGLGQWQGAELRRLLRPCLEKGLTVMPVLLPGARALPRELPFLRDLNSVRFVERADEGEALDKLLWGITGISPNMGSRPTTIYKER